MPRNSIKNVFLLMLLFIVFDLLSASLPEKHYKPNSCVFKSQHKMHIFRFRPELNMECVTWVEAELKWSAGFES